MGNAAILFLSILGLWIATYFTGVFYKFIKPDVFWIPRICQLTEQSCLTVLDAPQAKLFGMPNSLFGMGMYLYLILDLLFFPPYLGLIFLGLAVARSAYLAYSLLFITKIPCPLCFTSHVINLILFIFILSHTLSV